MKNNPSNTCHHLGKNDPSERKGMVGKPPLGTHEFRCWTLVFCSPVLYRTVLYPFLWMGNASRKLPVRLCEISQKLYLGSEICGSKQNVGLRIKEKISPHLGTTETCGICHRHLWVYVLWSRSTLIRSHCRLRVSMHIAPESCQFFTSSGTCRRCNPDHAIYTGDCECSDVS